MKFIPYKKATVYKQAMLQHPEITKIHNNPLFYKN